MTRDPIRPECRDVSRLLVSEYVQRGQCYRMAPQPDIAGHGRHLVVMHPLDRLEMIAQWGILGLAMVLGGLDIDQEIADIMEQVFQDKAKADGQALPGPETPSGIFRRPLS